MKRARTGDALLYLLTANDFSGQAVCLIG